MHEAPGTEGVAGARWWRGVVASPWRGQWVGPPGDLAGFSPAEAADSL